MSIIKGQISDMRKGAAEPVRVVPSSAIRVTSTFADVAYFKDVREI